MTMSLYRTDKDVSTAAAEVLFVLAPAYLIGVCCAGLLGVAFSWQVAVVLLTTAFVSASMGVTIG